MWKYKIMRHWLLSTESRVEEFTSTVREFWPDSTLKTLPQTTAGCGLRNYCLIKIADVFLAIVHVLQI